MKPSSSSNPTPTHSPLPRLLRSLVGRFFRPLFSLNTASLALFRVLLALTILWHLASSYGAVITLLSAPLALLLLLGYRTQLVAIMLCALNLTIAFVGSHSSWALFWLPLMCFWCVYLPVNAQWSVDAALQRKFKQDPNSDNDASTESPSVQTLFSTVTLLAVWQLLILIAGATFEAGFQLWPVLLLGFALVLPAGVWQRWTRWLRTTTSYQKVQQLIIYYDEDCGFCLKMCLVLRTLLLTPETKIITAQSKLDVYAIMEQHNSWVVKTSGGDTYIHWHAMNHLFAQRWPFKPLAWLMNIHPLIRWGNAVYRWVADNRATMSDITVWALPWSTIKLQPTGLNVFLALLSLGALVAAFLQTLLHL